MKLLTTEWLISDADDLERTYAFVDSQYTTFNVTIVDRRQRELVRIRQIFIPELILRLHHILTSSRKWVPE
jgi:nuclear pore complex protein Nup107